MTEFKCTASPVFLNGKDTYRLYLSIGVLSMGDTIVPVKNKTVTLIVLSKPVGTYWGWQYDVQLVDSARFNDPPFFPDFLPEGTKMIRIGTYSYSGDSMDWGPTKPFEESLTPQQALHLAIETLENFRDEYSDVGPIIDKLNKAL
jgi:hypothetical protein